MRVANPLEKPPVAVMLVLESVESPAGDQVLRGAARQLVANLSPQDLVGVANGETGVVVPLQRRGQRQEGRARHHEHRQLRGPAQLRALYPGRSQPPWPATRATPSTSWSWGTGTLMTRCRHRRSWRASCTRG